SLLRYSVMLRIYILITLSATISLAQYQTKPEKAPRVQNQDVRGIIKGVVEIVCSSGVNCPRPPPRPRCPFNEVLGCGCEPTCSNRNPSTCPQMCGCQCARGYVRHSSNQCIAPSACPQQPTTCPSNQVWNQCSTVCEPSCQSPNPTCHSFACGPPTCQCRPNFYRQYSANSPCIPWWQCRRGTQPGPWRWWTSRPRG
ncbi:hypothetical protein PMAYCL1PPCAC_15204, partial [Pristionchus mayeri]